MQLCRKIANFMFKMLGTEAWPQARRSGQWSRWHEKSLKSVESISSYSWSVARMTTLVLLINFSIVNQHQFPKKQVWIQQNERNRRKLLVFLWSFLHLSYFFMYHRVLSYVLTTKQTPVVGAEISWFRSTSLVLQLDHGHRLTPFWNG